MHWYIEKTKRIDRKMTIGVEFVRKDIKLNENQNIGVDFWRLGGQARFGAIRSNFYKGASGSIIFYNLKDSEQGFKYFTDRYNEIQEFVGNVPVLVIAVDLEEDHGKAPTEFDEKIKKIIEKDGNLYIQCRNEIIEDIEEGIKKLSQMIVKREEKRKSEELSPSEKVVIEKLEEIIGKKIPKLQVNVEDIFGYKIENSHSIELYLRNFGIKELPKNIGDLKYLKIIDLESNQLNSIPPSIKKLKSLALINLSNNQFTSIPIELWSLINLKLIDLKKNPWQGESKEFYDKSPEIIRDFCRKRANIHIFLSHAVNDFREYRIKELSTYLNNQEEIYKSYYCEEDLKGNIDEFMNQTIPQCHLLLFIATRNSVFNSVDCKYELMLAKKHKLQIIPIRGKDIAWSELINIGLSRELGLEFNDTNFNIFCEDIYQYILEFKRKIDLINREKGRIDKININIMNILEGYLKSELSNMMIKKNTNKVEDIIEKYRSEKISFKKFLRKLKDII